MTLFEHLAEFRDRLIKAVAAIVAGTIFGWVFYNQIFHVLAHPIYQVIEQKAREGQDVKLVFTGITDAFNLRLKLSFYTGIVISSPLWLWQLWRFITPGLHKHERRWALLFVGAAVPLFLLGVGMGYWVMPGAIRVLLGFTPTGASNYPRVDEYLSFELSFLLVVGAGFLTPLVLVMLNFLGLLSGKAMLRWWRWIILITLFVAALATPTGDPVTMMTIAAPLAILIFIAVGISLLNDRRRRRHGGEPDYESFDDDEASPLPTPQPVEDPDSVEDNQTR